MLSMRACVRASAAPVWRYPLAPRAWSAAAEAISSSVGTAVVSEPPKPRRRVLRAPLSITDEAAERIKVLIGGKPEAIGVRLGVKRRGCNGLSYTLNYAESVEPKDEEVADKGVRVFIEPMAMFHVVGTTMHWEETALSAEFTFNNPNEKGRCGCGESFNV